MKRFSIVWHRVLSLSLASFLLVAWLSLGVGTAHASPTILSCIGTSVSQYSPGLTNQLQSTRVSTIEDYNDCLAPGSNLSAGIASFTVTEVASCLVSASAPQPTVTYHWNDGSTSTVHFTVTTVVRLADGSTQVTSAGPVLSGFGAGSLATRVKVIPQLDVLLCESSQGVTEQRGPSTLEFV